MTTAAIIGDGQMGLVLANLLVENGIEVRLWSRTPEKARRLDETRSSPDRLPGFELAAAVRCSAEPALVSDGATLIVNAIPTQFIRGVWADFVPRTDPAALAVSVSKGVEQETLLCPTQIIDAVRGDDAMPSAALSGPTIAAELARCLPATVVAAAPELAVAERIQTLFSAPWLRVYTHDDLMGVEVAGAAKNVIALAAGLIDGLEIGFNAKSALLARGLAEISRLGAAMGARRETFFGIAGVGDLATTCFSPYGRNRSCGEKLGRGMPLEEILAGSTMVVEGVPSTKSIVVLADRLGVEMPITEAVHGILFEGLAPGAAIKGLMERDKKQERVG